MLMVKLIGLYQRHAPKWVKGHCRNVPHCSEYGKRACEINGNIRGALMAYRRVMSCGAIASAVAMTSMPHHPEGFFKKHPCYDLGVSASLSGEAQRAECCLTASLMPYKPEDAFANCKWLGLGLGAIWEEEKICRSKKHYW